MRCNIEEATNHTMYCQSLPTISLRLSLVWYWRFVCTINISWFRFCTRSVNDIVKHNRSVIKKNQSHSVVSLCHIRSVRNVVIRLSIMINWGVDLEDVPHQRKPEISLPCTASQLKYFNENCSGMGKVNDHNTAKVEWDSELYNW